MGIIFIHIVYNIVIGPALVGTGNSMNSSVKSNPGCNPSNFTSKLAL